MLVSGFCLCFFSMFWFGMLFGILCILLRLFEKQIRWVGILEIVLKVLWIMVVCRILLKVLMCGKFDGLQFVLNRIQFFFGVVFLQCLIRVWVFLKGQVLFFIVVVCKLFIFVFLILLFVFMVGFKCFYYCFWG